MIESKSIAFPLGYSPIMVGSDGFEPPKHEVTDLQSAAFGHFANYPIKSSLFANTLILYNRFLKNKIFFILI